MLSTTGTGTNVNAVGAVTNMSSPRDTTRETDSAACAGDSQRIVLSLTYTATTSASPKKQLRSSWKENPDPVMVTLVPPSDPPTGGATFTILACSVYVKVWLIPS